MDWWTSLTWPDLLAVLLWLCAVAWAVCDFRRLSKRTPAPTATPRQTQGQDTRPDLPHPGLEQPSTWAASAAWEPFAPSQSHVTQSSALPVSQKAAAVEIPDATALIAPINEAVAPIAESSAAPTQRRQHDQSTLILIERQFEPGLPGYIYVMRSDFHREHVYKVGFTRRAPDVRRLELDSQASEVGDVSEFRLIAARRVEGCAECEIALFEAMPERRVTMLREYFHGTEEAIRAAVSAIVATLVDGVATPTCALPADHWKASPAVPWAHVTTCRVPARPSPEGGWIYVLRNFWHRDGVHKVVCSRRDVSSVQTRINAAQKAATSQLGFYEVVAARGVHSVPAARTQIRALLGDIRIDRGRDHFDAPLAELERRLAAMSDLPPQSTPDRWPLNEARRRSPAQSLARSSLKSGVPRKSASRRLCAGATPDLFDPQTEPSLHDEFAVTALNPNWKAWTARCDACKTPVRYFAQFDERANVACDVCSHNTRIHPGKHVL